MNATDRVPVRIWSLNTGRDEVAVHFRPEDLSASGIQVGDVLVLDINRAVVRGIVSANDEVPWLGTRGVEGWSHRRITDALRDANVAHRSEHLALIVERNGIALRTADPSELYRRTAAVQAAGSPIATPQGNPSPARVQRVVTEFERDPAIVAAVLRDANGNCALCNCPAPFLRSDGSPFLEVHHVRMLVDGGADTMDNTVALCPNCHRLMHHASDEDRASATQQLRDRLGRFVRSPA